MATLYMMMGYPGAGKTTIAEALHKATGAVHLSSDNARFELFKQPTFSQDEHDLLYKHLDRRTEQLLKTGLSVIYDANLNRRQHRLEKYDISKRIGAKTVLVWVKTPKEVAKERATHVGRFHLVPEGETASQMFDRITHIIEEPGDEEPYITVDGTKITNKDITKIINT